MSNLWWWPMEVAENTTRSAIRATTEIDSASTAQPTVSKQLPKFPQVSWSNWPNNSRSQHFVQLWEAIDRMSRLPEHHQYHLNRAVATKAILFLNEFSNNYDGPLPLLLPEDQDNIALTWERDLIKTFINLNAEEQDILMLNKKSQISCDVDLPDDFPSAMNEVLHTLSFPPRARSSAE